MVVRSVRRSVLVLFLVGALAGAAHAGVAVLPPDEQPPLEMEIVEFGPVHVAYTEHRGSYEKLGKAISGLFKELGKQDVEYSGSLMAIYYDSPEEVPESDLRWDVAVEVPEGTQVAGPLGVKVLPRCVVARTHYKGPPENIGPVYERLVGEAVARGFVPVGPAIEAYAAMPTARSVQSTIMFVVEEPGRRGIGAELVIMEPQLLAFTEHAGGAEQIGPATEAFFAELEAQGVEPAGPLMHVFLSGPGELPEEELRWRVAIRIHGEREVGEPLMLEGVPERIVARTAFWGPDEALPEVYGRLAEYAMGRGYVPKGPALMAYPIPLPGPEGPPEPDAPPEPGVAVIAPEDMPGEPEEPGPGPERLAMFVVEKLPPIRTEIVIMGPHPLVFVGHGGGLEGMHEAAEGFYRELEAQGVEAHGPLMRTFFTDPEHAPEGETYWELAVRVPEEREVAEPLQLKIFPECACARASYHGPVEGVRMAHGVMVEQVAERGWFPVSPLMQILPEPAHEGRVECVLLFVVAKGEPGPEPEPGIEPEPEPGPDVMIIKPIPVKIIKPKPQPKPKPVIE